MTLVATHIFSARICSLTYEPSDYFGLPCSIVERYGGYTQAGFDCTVRVHVTPEEMCERINKRLKAEAEAHRFSFQPTTVRDITSGWEEVIAKHGPGVYIEASEKDDLTPSVDQVHHHYVDATQ